MERWIKAYLYYYDLKGHIPICAVTFLFASMSEKASTHDSIFLVVVASVMFFVYFIDLCMEIDLLFNEPRCTACGRRFRALPLPRRLNIYYERPCFFIYKIAKIWRRHTDLCDVQIAMIKHLMREDPSILHELRIRYSRSKKMDDFLLSLDIPNFIFEESRNACERCSGSFRHVRRVNHDANIRETPVDMPRLHDHGGGGHRRRS